MAPRANQKGKRRQPPGPIHFEGFTSSEEDEPTVRGTIAVARRRSQQCRPSRNGTTRIKKKQTKVAKNRDLSTGSASPSEKPRRILARPAGGKRYANVNAAAEDASSESSDASSKDKIARSNKRPRRSTATTSLPRSRVAAKKGPRQEKAQKSKQRHATSYDNIASNTTSRNNAASSQRAPAIPTSATADYSRGWRTKSQLLDIARRHNGMAIQYRITYHESTKPVKNHNPGSTEDIHQGDLCVKSRFMCVSGNGGGCTYSFQNWKLPGSLHSTRSARHVTIYSDTRPNFFKEEMTETSYPIIVIDSCLTDVDQSTVMRFLSQAPAGSTPELFGHGTRLPGTEPAGVTGDVEDSSHGTDLPGEESVAEGLSGKEESKDRISCNDDAYSTGDKMRIASEVFKPKLSDSGNESHSKPLDDEENAFHYNDAVNAFDFDDTSNDQDDKSPDSTTLNLRGSSSGSIKRSAPTKDKVAVQALEEMEATRDEREALSNDGKNDERQVQKSIRRKRKATTEQNTFEKRPRPKSYGGVKHRQRKTVSFVVGGEVSCPSQFFALIEGIGGGSEETKKPISRFPNATESDPALGAAWNENVESLPHRGRIIELPGEARKGRWTAEVVDVSPSPRRITRAMTRVGLLGDRIKDLEGLRICLRHDKWKTLAPLANQSLGGSSELCPQNETDNNTRDKEEDVTVTDFNPNHNRVWSFVSQGVLDEEEVGSEVHPFIGSISIVTFDGFTSSSEATRTADKVSSGFLDSSRNAATADEKKEDVLEESLRHLLPIPKSVCRNPQQKIDKKSSALSGGNIGVSFPCKIQFADHYSLLVAHDKKGFVVAVDVTFGDEVQPSISSLGSSATRSHKQERSILTAEALKQHTERTKKAQRSKRATEKVTSPNSSDMSFGHHSQGKIKVPRQIEVSLALDSSAEANFGATFDHDETNGVPDGPTLQDSLSGLDKEASNRSQRLQGKSGGSTLKPKALRQGAKAVDGTIEKNHYRRKLSSFRSKPEVLRECEGPSSVAVADQRRNKNYLVPTAASCKVSKARENGENRQTRPRAATSVSAKVSKGAKNTPSTIAAPKPKKSHVTSCTKNDRNYFEIREFHRKAPHDAAEKKVKFHNVPSFDLGPNPTRSVVASSRTKLTTCNHKPPPDVAEMEGGCNLRERSQSARTMNSNQNASMSGGATSNQTNKGNKVLEGSDTDHEAPRKTPPRKAEEAVALNDDGEVSIYSDPNAGRSGAASSKATKSDQCIDGRLSHRKASPKKTDDTNQDISEESHILSPVDVHPNASGSDVVFNNRNEGNKVSESRYTQQIVSTAVSRGKVNRNQSKASRCASLVGADPTQSRNEDQVVKSNPVMPSVGTSKESKIQACSVSSKAKDKSLQGETGDHPKKNQRCSGNAPTIMCNNTEARTPKSSAHLPLVTPLQNQGRKRPSLDYDKGDLPGAMSGNPFVSRLQKTTLSELIGDECCDEVDDDSTAHYTARESLGSVQWSLASQNVARRSDQVAQSLESPVLSRVPACPGSEVNVAPLSSHWPSMHDVFYGVHDEREHTDYLMQESDAVNFDEGNTDSALYAANTILWGSDHDSRDEHVFESEESPWSGVWGERAFLDSRRLLFLLVLALLLPVARDTQGIGMTMPLPQGAMKRTPRVERSSRQVGRAQRTSSVVRGSLFRMADTEDRVREEEESLARFVLPYFATIFGWLVFWGW